MNRDTPQERTTLSPGDISYYVKISGPGTGHFPMSQGSLEALKTRQTVVNCSLLSVTTKYDPATETSHASVVGQGEVSLELTRNALPTD